MPPLPSHHRPRGGFQNRWPGATEHGLADFLWWVVVERLTTRRPPDPDPRVFERVAPDIAIPRATTDALAATWIGHSSLLLQIGAVNVLTDPIWSERASPFTFLGPTRWVAPGLTLDALPPIDLIVISHSHYDHLDATTVRALAGRYPEARWLAPLGLGRWLRRRGAARVNELDWWEEIDVAGLRLGCTPAQHFSARGVHDRNRTLWCGWTLSGPGTSVYFAGDTGYHPEFGAIATRLGPFDLAALPVGAYEPRWFMGPVHMNPEDAVQAWADLASAHPGSPPPAMLPIHWGTFKLTDEPMDEPPRRLRELWERSGHEESALWLLRHGETRRRIPD